MPELVQQILFSKDYEKLREVGRRIGVSGRWVQIDLHTCSNCGRTNTITLRAGHMVQNKHGQSEKLSVITDRLLIDPEDLAKLIPVCNEIQSNPPAAQTDPRPS